MVILVRNGYVWYFCSGSVFRIPADVFSHPGPEQKPGVNDGTQPPEQGDCLLGSGHADRRCEYVVLGASAGTGFLFGGIWNTINLWVLKQLFVSILIPRLSMLTLFWLTIKIPLLYGTGAVILLTVPLSAGAGILGFHVPFAVLLMAALYYQKACNPAHLPIEFQTTQRDGKR